MTGSNNLVLTCIALLSLSALQQTACASENSKSKPGVNKPLLAQAKEELLRLAKRVESGVVGKRLNSLGQDAAWVVQYGYEQLLDPYVDLGFQSLRLFKKRSARHYRAAQIHFELGKDWVLAQVAAVSATKVINQPAEESLQDIEDVFVQDLLVEETTERCDEPATHLSEEVDHEEL